MSYVLINPNGMTDQYGKILAILIFFVYGTSTYVQSFRGSQIMIRINMARFLPYCFFSNYFEIVTW